MQSDNIKFIFISLNLFILIFFILLATYASLNNNLQPIHDIFRSFRGEDTSAPELIALSAEEQRLIKAQKYFKDKLEIILNEKEFYDLSLNKDKNILNDNNILYKLNYDFEKAFIEGTYLTNNFKNFLESIMIDENAYGYSLCLELSLNRDEVINNNIDLSKIVNIINLFKKSRNKLYEISIKLDNYALSGKMLLKLYIARAIYN